MFPDTQKSGAENEELVDPLPGKLRQAVVCHLFPLLKHDKLLFNALSISISFAQKIKGIEEEIILNPFF